MNKFKITELIVTFFYIGKIKYCPGTFGSLAAYIVSGLVVYIAERIVFALSTPNDLIIAGFYLFGIPIILGLLFIFLFVVGVHYSNIYIKHTGIQDPQEIVIDEVTGQLLTIILCIPSAIILFMIYSDSLKYAILLWYLPSFILFRLFDIFKPWPINVIDQNVKGGIGVMLDDIAASIFASITTYVVIFLLI